MKPNYATRQSQGWLECVEGEPEEDGGHDGGLVAGGPLIAIRK